VLFFLYPASVSAKGTSRRVYPARVLGAGFSSKGFSKGKQTIFNVLKLLGDRWKRVSVDETFVGENLPSIQCSLRNTIYIPTFLPSLGLRHPKNNNLPSFHGTSPQRQK